MPRMRAPLTIPTPSHGIATRTISRPPLPPRRMKGRVGRATRPRSTRASTLVSSAPECSFCWTRPRSIPRRATASTAGMCGYWREGLAELSKGELGGLESGAYSPWARRIVRGDRRHHRVPGQRRAARARAERPLSLGLCASSRSLASGAIDRSERSSSRRPHATPLFMGRTSCKKIVTCHDTIPARFPRATSA